jgi:acyl-CoA reductase-like NAD-dependent aldehyde dehydrogenase
MVHKLSHLLAPSALALALALPISVTRAETNQATASQAAQTRARNTQRERHPAIRAAIRSLEKAKYDLQHAAHDFGGHRADALQAVDSAINQLRLALQSDKQ